MSHLLHLLEANTHVQDHTSPGLTFYPSGDSTPKITLTYGEFSSLARGYSSHLRQAKDFSPGKVVLLYSDNHFDNIVWFWATIYAGGIPAPSTSFSNNSDQREKQIAHLRSQLCEPIFLTQEGLLDQFPNDKNLNVITIVQLRSQPEAIKVENHDLGLYHHPEDLAALMLTSGSTGRSKAVRLTHRQIIASISGKARVRPLPKNTTFLNWVALDHVANLTEIHLHAMYLGASQIHVSAAEVVSNPEWFLHLLDQHNVGRTFAPNFFLSKLKDLLQHKEDERLPPMDLDLSRLVWLGTGGEATSVETCASLMKLLSPYKVASNVIAPGFGMTETCAGAIYNDSCPGYDIENGYAYTSLGHCMPGIEMRISLPFVGDDETTNPSDQVGELEVRGDVVFAGYFNNQEATAEAFTPDGWFKTGDRAYLDGKGNLVLSGRKNDTININGVKFNPQDIESAIEDAKIEGVQPTYVLCFDYRRNGMKAPSICILYAPAYPMDDLEARSTAQRSIKTSVMLETGVSPYVVPLPISAMPKSTLGKLSRKQMRSALEEGRLKEYEEHNLAALKLHQAGSISPPNGPTEQIIVEEFSKAVGVGAHELSVETPLYDFGITSVQLIALKRCIEDRLRIPPIPTITLMTNPTVRQLATKVSRADSPIPDDDQVDAYNPVITLQAHGHKTPLWLVHPGVGEVLVFLNLARYITDRPVHAIRARGFERHESYFQSIEEAVTCYHGAMKRAQPHGPYAIAGYSYGAMLAFELAKKLQKEGDEVRFVGSFNLPPHIKFRMRQLVWSECLLHLAYFLNLISESKSREISEELAPLPHEDAIDLVWDISDKERLQELSLTKEVMQNWVGVSFALQSMARDYDPSGSVPSIDIFCAIPLAVVAANKEIWIEQHLSRWADFSESEPRVHDVDGSHYTMISEEHVGQFQKKLKKALKDRGL